MRRAAALIVGGGPAGSAAAITLARHGLHPLLIERDAAAADALCGGFLSWMTLKRLGALGLDPGTLGGEPIVQVRLFAGRREAGAALPAAARGLSRRTLDAALLARAAEEGAAIERGVTGRAWDEGRLRLDDGGLIEADALLLATGKHELRGLIRPRGRHPAIGLRTRLPATEALRGAIAGTIELHLFRGGYAGLLLQEDGTANLCLAANRERLAQAGGEPERLIAAIAAESPRLGDRIAAAGGHGPIQAIAGVPYGWRADGGPTGLFRLGDQAAVIPSLAGEGIAIAIASGAGAAHTLAEAGPSGAAAWQQHFARRLARPFMTSGLLRRVGAQPGGAAAIVAAVRLAPPLAALVARWTRAD